MITLHYYGIFIGIGIAVGHALITHKYVQDFLSLINIFIIGIASYIGGLTWVFIKNGAIARAGSISVLGAVPAGIITALGLAWYQKKRITYIAQDTFIALLLVHAFGRIGCFSAGCCSGNIVIAGNTIPLQLVGSCWYFMWYLLLRTYPSWWFLYPALVGIERFLAEFFRDFPTNPTSSVTLSLIILCTLSAIGGMYHYQKTKAKRIS